LVVGILELNSSIILLLNTMMPILFKCSFFTVYTYGVFVALAFLAATSLVSWEAKRQGMDEDLIYNLCVTILVSGIVFARFFYVGLNWDYFRDNLLDVIKLQHGGLVWYGGLIGALASSLAFMKRKKLKVLATLDLLAPYAALVQAIGRIGCFFNGCCYGVESGWGVYFPVHAKVLFPSQILDSATLLLIFVVLKVIAEKDRRGETLIFYFILASFQRFLMEFVRGDERPFYLSLSIFQWISLGLFFCGLFLYGALFLWKKRTRS